MTETLTRPPRQSRHLSDFTALTAKIKAEGLLRRSYGYYWSMLIGLPLVLVGLGAVSVWVGDSWWQIAVAIAVACLMAQFGFLGHDAAHRQIFASGKWNERAAMIIANLVVGLGIGWWQNKHSRHHAGPNKIGIDPDIKTDVLVFTPQGLDERTSPLSRWLTGKQGYFFFPLLFLAGLQLHVNSFKHLFARGKVKNRALELTLLIIRHVGLITFAFVVMSPPIAITFLAVQLLVFGFHLGMAFAPNHIGRPVVPAEVKIDFLRRQVLMSRNISGGAGVSVLLGGLNYQIEHHLFPSMSRPNLARTAPIVQEYCRELGIDYHQTSLPQAYVEVGRYINAVGRGGVDLWTCPLAASMGRG
ncbi:fatty acid desaturase family protein [Propionibacteriaceae bacterium Y1685]|uniref:fatty acid desaturase family protein n=1 Tax=Microlunatus sp. Y1700 TaxID=3418487 RepID=UPI003B7FE2FB